MAEITEKMQDAYLFTDELYNKFENVVRRNRTGKNQCDIKVGDVNILKGVYSVESNDDSITLLTFDNTVKAIIFIGIVPEVETLEMLNETGAELYKIDMLFGIELMMKKLRLGQIDIEVVTIPPKINWVDSPNRDIMQELFGF